MSASVAVRATSSSVSQGSKSWICSGFGWMASRMRPVRVLIVGIPRQRSAAWGSTPPLSAQTANPCGVCTGAMSSATPRLRRVTAAKSTWSPGRPRPTLALSGQ